MIETRSGPNRAIVWTFDKTWGVRAQIDGPSGPVFIDIVRPDARGPEVMDTSPIAMLDHQAAVELRDWLTRHLAEIPATSGLTRTATPERSA